MKKKWSDIKVDIKNQVRSPTSTSTSAQVSYICIWFSLFICMFKIQTDAALLIFILFQKIVQEF